jgi:hypothetical protein
MYNTGMAKLFALIDYLWNVDSAVIQALINRAKLQTGANGISASSASDPYCPGAGGANRGSEG